MVPARLQALLQRRELGEQLDALLALEHGRDGRALISSARVEYDFKRLARLDRGGRLGPGTQQVHQPDDATRLAHGFLVGGACQVGASWPGGHVASHAEVGVP